MGTRVSALAVLLVLLPAGAFAAGASPWAKPEGTYPDGTEAPEAAGAGCTVDADCDDNDPCTDDVCHPTMGCRHATNSASCDDGDACTVNDKCFGGDCQPGMPADCDDGNVCTDDGCDHSTGCTHTPSSDGCDDGDACTEGDSCSEGNCLGGWPIDCDDGKVCTDDGCDQTTGCFHVDNTDPCEDGDACTAGDQCSAGACVAGGPADCDDGKLCTTDGCDPATGCTHTNNSSPCDDGDACTAGDICASGICVGGLPVECDDDNACTDDACDPTTGCTFTNNSEACNDNDACTTGDACSAGACQGGPPVDCDDGDVCTDDTCHDVVGCINTNNTAACEDGDACTVGDTCADGTCTAGAPADCDDDNVCTDDGCDSSTGCTHTPNAADCDDGDACTTSDACANGTCYAGMPVDCDDDNPCTDDDCDHTTGCTNTDKPEGSACDVNDRCVLEAECHGQVCTRTLWIICNDDDACTSDWCDPVTGDCGSEDISHECDDENGCTDDSCDPVEGCTNTNNTAACDDGDACTVGDACAEGACAGGAPADCDDGNVCTDNACDPATGCVNTPNEAACDDGDGCTVQDSCSQGTCMGGMPADCDDDNVCTDDGCDPAAGCTHTSNTATCDDGDACTTGDTCADGTCAGGTTIECDPNATCQGDSADHPCVCNEHFEGDGLVCTKSEEDLNVSVTGAGSDDKLEASEGDEEVPAVSTLLAAGPYQDIVVSGVSVSASGEGDDAADLKKVSLARVLEDGSYELLGWGTFSEDDGSLDFAGAPLLTVPAGDKTKLVVLYEFAGAGAGGGIVDTRAPSSTPGTPPVLPWLLFASLLFVFWAASRLPISSPAPAAVCVLLLATAALSCEREGMPWWPPDVADAAGTDLDGAGEDTGEAEDEGEAEDDPGSTGDAETVEEGRTFRATITAIDAKGSKSDEAIKIEGLPAAGPIIELR